MGIRKGTELKGKLADPIRELIGDEKKGNVTFFCSDSSKLLRTRRAICNLIRRRGYLLRTSVVFSSIKVYKEGRKDEENGCYIYLK